MSAPFAEHRPSWVVFTGRDDRWAAVETSALQARGSVRRLRPWAVLPGLLRSHLGRAGRLSARSPGRPAGQPAARRRRHGRSCVPRRESS